MEYIAENYGNPYMKDCSVYDSDRNVEQVDFCEPWLGECFGVLVHDKDCDIVEHVGWWEYEQDYYVIIDSEKFLAGNNIIDAREFAAKMKEDEEDKEIDIEGYVARQIIIIDSDGMECDF